MSKEKDTVLVRYSVIKLPLFLLPLSFMAWGFITGGRDSGQFLMEAGGYAFGLIALGIFLHAIACRGRVVQIRDGRLVYSLFRPRGEDFADIAAISLYTYPINFFDVKVIAITRYSGVQVFLMGWLLAGKAEANVARLRAVVGLPDPAVISAQT